MNTLFNTIHHGSKVPSLGPVYARFFSSSVLKELAHTGHSTTASRLLRQYHLFEQFHAEMAVKDFYNEIFEQLVKNYRHEYIYKNAIAEKILLGKHNLNTAFMLTEFRADDCFADAIVLNGTSHVYEIKSEMDSFDRLDRQISAYRKLFDFITVITSERLYSVIETRLSKGIGIMVLADRGYAFRRNPRREPVSNRNNVNPIAILNSLQQKEYLKIINNVFGKSLKTIPNTMIYSEAKKLFERLPPEIAHDAMVDVLTKRRDTRRISDFIADVPKSLKAASLSMQLTNAERMKFIDILQKNISVAFT
jgi:hypothetical protein